MNLEVDAVPKYPKELTNLRFLNLRQNNGQQRLDLLLDRLSVEDFKSAFFLLLKDYIKYEEYLLIVKQDITCLKGKFIETCEKFNFNENLLVELFGTLKNFEVLNKLGTCQHVFEHRLKEFHRIEKFWKFLYTVAEEIEDSQINDLRQKLLQNLCDEDLSSVEEVFCFALMKDVFHKFNLSKLEEALQNNSGCLLLIKKFNEELSQATYYHIRKPTQNSPCGIAVIINHEEFYKENCNSPNLLKREGSYKDVGKLVCLWKTFGFKTKVYNERLTDKEVLELFTRLANIDHSNYDAFIACYLSHGHKDTVFASNSKEIEINLLLNIMANKCRSLVGKPKLFFIQACQGDKIQQGLRPNSYQGVLPSVQQSHVESDGPGTNQTYSLFSSDVPAFSDIFQVIATYPGYVSYRSPSEGSWFISALVDRMECSGDKLPLSSIIPKVTDDVAQKNGVLSPLHINCKQTVMHYSTLRYELKLKKM